MAQEITNEQVETKIKRAEELSEVVNRTKHAATLLKKCLEELKDFNVDVKIEVNIDYIGKVLSKAS